MSRDESQPLNVPRRGYASGKGTLSPNDAVEAITRPDGSIDIDATMKVLRKRLRRQTYYVPIPGRRRMLRHVRTNLLTQHSTECDD